MGSDIVDLISKWLIADGQLLFSSLMWQNIGK